MYTINKKKNVNSESIGVVVDFSKKNPIQLYRVSSIDFFPFFFFFVRKPFYGNYTGKKYKPMYFFILHFAIRLRASSYFIRAYFRDTRKRNHYMEDVLSNSRRRVNIRIINQQEKPLAKNGGPLVQIDVEL